MNTNFNNMLVRATVSDMLERAAEARANRGSGKSGMSFKVMLLAAIPIVLWIGWTLIAG